jgi:predicted ester cyclase
VSHERIARHRDQNLVRRSLESRTRGYDRPALRGRRHGARPARRLDARTAGVSAHLHDVPRRLPDIHIEVERTITEGDLVAAHCRVTGTHRGGTLGFAPTGRRVDFHGVTIARIVDGQFREGWNSFDFLTLYQQLGVVSPNPGQ